MSKYQNKSNGISSVCVCLCVTDHRCASLSALLRYSHLVCNRPFFSSFLFVKNWITQSDHDPNIRDKFLLQFVYSQNAIVHFPSTKISHRRKPNVSVGFKAPARPPAHTHCIRRTGKQPIHSNVKLFTGFSVRKFHYNSLMIPFVRWHFKLGYAWARARHTRNYF